MASDLLGDTAIPEDLGALRLIFQDCVPSVGPQKYFPQVKTAMNVESSLESMSVEELDKSLRGISGKVYSTLRVFTSHFTSTHVDINII